MDKKPNYFIVNPLIPNNIKTIKIQKPTLNIFNELIWETFEVIFDPDKIEQN